MSASALLFAALFLGFNIVQCAEFVPCFMWSNKRTNEHVPALNRVNQDIFKNEIKHYLDEGYLLVIFAEQTLSPEDFAQHDPSAVTFPNLVELKKSTRVSYLPNVQNPITALKHLDVSITEVPVDKFGKSFEIPETDVLVVNLNDAKDSEDRIVMLKRHDAAIAAIFEDLSRKHDNILAVYTAYHTSWVASEEVVKSRLTRSLLEDTSADTGSTTNSEVPIPPYGNSTHFYKTSNIYLYVSEANYTYDDTVNTIKFDYFINTSNSTYYTLTASGSSKHNIVLKMSFTNNGSSGYWEQVDEITAVISNSTLQENTLTLIPTAPIYAPEKFSFHCGDQFFSNDSLKILLKDFQIQLLFNNENSTNKFGDAYDCVGFTTVPIWSGLFVTAILLIIMTIGITMMMDIRTMDRFDDAKGKTITINAE
ncbi:V-type proton ATPase subunit S1 [Diorhabda carinulata]|uniref:V-type proton ATPase subunit S1 n=1 Tax=Diorhabda carinulata TaxID=1163345 RepID=UPI0025A2BD5A|nr:V-type proton ATPase subunit S1 [Diorhabda carinulata]